ncbi:uncharacterized protein LOC111258853 isoform X3 [Varroa jacobsoni]|uniref:Coiled-coil domain-containing protein n=1 Tax=Varroa destructor TaxID=109461 RepID=A0A7M7KGR6_VARDE|nr:uncharacterized protein LOC111252356 isoform X2 [Varroa destructor]XP_022686149.1 uncharacterized protein LOC111258853 isoform X3 [Varroa jacobsoni]
MEDGNDHNYRRSKVRQACQNWQILEDEGLAYSLQNEEITEHYDRNRQNSRLVRDDFKTARREQTFEQEMLERSRQQEEAEAEELAAQLALLLDEERQEEDAMRLDEQLARKLAQEDDEAIAREQQDRELARMLQARERVKTLWLARQCDVSLLINLHTVITEAMKNILKNIRLLNITKLEVRALHLLEEILIWLWMTAVQVLHICQCRAFQNVQFPNVVYGCQDQHIRP